MIKVSILGGDTPDGGELIRLLAMHPDVELLSVQSSALEGTPVTRHHHGLIGETTLSFTSSVDYSKCDVLFVCTPTLTDSDFDKIRESRPELKIILLERSASFHPENHGVVYGLPEINRKPLVRGATAAFVPESFASMALVALYPFACNLLLADDIAVSVVAPQAIIDTTDLPEVEKEIATLLSETQKSFSGKVHIDVQPSDARRSALMDIELKCPLSLQQLIDIYDIYDDHRFSFVTTSPVGVSEVAGTNKCIIRVSKSEQDKVELGIAADCRLRGAAGEAVHIMNLLCGLHEKTGLALKAIDFDRI